MSDARRIAAFGIPAVEADQADDTMFVSLVWEHLNFVSTFAGFADDEMPAMAPHARDLWSFRNDCHGSGVAEFSQHIVGNDGFYARVTAMLATLGLARHTEFFEELVAFEHANGDLIAELYQAGRDEEARAHYVDFEDRLFALEYGKPAIAGSLAVWLRAQPWITIDPSLAGTSFDALQAQYPDHPDKAARNAASLRRRKAETSTAWLANLRDQLRG